MTEFDWRERLFADRSLFHIFWKSGGSLKTPANFLILSSVLIFSSTVVILVAACRPELIAPSMVVETVRSWSAFGASFSTTILGFLITGFAIFATISKPELFAALARMLRADGKTDLEYAFYPFINCFVHYILYAGFSIIVTLLSAKGSFTSSLIGSLLSYDVSVWIFSVYVVVVITWTVTLLLKLKSFVWNIYQTMMLCIADVENE